MNKILKRSRSKKNDAFYTELSDIELELPIHANSFKDKSVYLNCDNPSQSKFWEYFITHFSELGLKKLTATYYNTTGISTVTEVTSNSYRITPLKGDGDFRSDECVELLKAADIIVTNPPFSLAREFIDLLTKHNKDFLIISNLNALTYKEVYPYVCKNEMWLGVNRPKVFNTPQGEYQKLGNIVWLTNLEYAQRYTDLNLTETFTTDKYFTFDNYPAINIDRTSDIPVDYKEIMGVPITFLHYWNPEQFEIIDGWNRGNPNATKTEYFDSKGVRHEWTGPTVNKKSKYFRFLIRRK